MARSNAKDEAFAAALDAEPAGPPSNKSKMETIFGERPRVRQALLDAFKRGVTAPRLALMVKEFSGEDVSEELVRKWAKKNTTTTKPS